MIAVILSLFLFSISQAQDQHSSFDPESPYAPQANSEQALKEEKNEEEKFFSPLFTCTATNEDRGAKVFPTSVALVDKEGNELVSYHYDEEHSLDGTSVVHLTSGRSETMPGSTTAIMTKNAECVAKGKSYPHKIAVYNTLGDEVFNGCCEASKKKKALNTGNAKAPQSAAPPAQASGEGSGLGLTIRSDVSTPNTRKTSEQRWDNIEESVSEGAQNAVERTKEGLQNAGKRIEEGYRKAQKSEAGKAGRKVKRGIGQGLDFIGEGLQRAGKRLKK